MSIQETLKKMKAIQNFLLTYLDSEDNIEENFQNLSNAIITQTICDDMHQLKLFLHLLVTISDNMHRGPNFFNKIEQILNIFIDEIKIYYPNNEIFIIFKENRRIILFLFEKDVLKMNKYILNEISRKYSFHSFKTKYRNYGKYFAPEIMNFISKNFYNRKNIDWGIYDAIEFYKSLINEKINDFNEKRKKGENDDLICSLIREDNVKEFICYTKQSNISLTSNINESIFESNSLLLDSKNQTLIEYASFCGSIKIFQYLQNNGVELTPSLWLYAIHGKNAEIIHQLEINHIEPSDKSYKNCIIESIKCHHNDIANYFINNYLQSDDDFCDQILKYYNFYFIQDNFINISTFNCMCRYDYYLFVNLFFKEKNIDVNKKILNKFI